MAKKEEIVIVEDDEGGEYPIPADDLKLWVKEGYTLRTPEPPPTVRDVLQADLKRASERDGSVLEAYGKYVQGPAIAGFRDMARAPEGTGVLGTVGAGVKGWWNQITDPKAKPAESRDLFKALGVDDTKKYPVGFGPFTDDWMAGPDQHFTNPTMVTKAQALGEAGDILIDPLAIGPAAVKLPARAALKLAESKLGMKGLQVITRKTPEQLKEFLNRPRAALEAAQDSKAMAAQLMDDVRQLDEATIEGKKKALAALSDSDSQITPDDLQKIIARGEEYLAQYRVGAAKEGVGSVSEGGYARLSKFIDRLKEVSGATPGTTKTVEQVVGRPQYETKTVVHPKHDPKSTIPFEEYRGEFEPGGRPFERVVPNTEEVTKHTGTRQETIKSEFYQPGEPGKDITMVEGKRLLEQIWKETDFKGVMNRAPGERDDIADRAIKAMGHDLRLMLEEKSPAFKEAMEPLRKDTALLRSLESTGFTNENTLAQKLDTLTTMRGKKRVLDQHVLDLLEERMGTKYRENVKDHAINKSLDGDVRRGAWGPAAGAAWGWAAGQMFPGSEAAKIFGPIAGAGIGTAVDFLNPSVKKLLNLYKSVDAATQMKMLELFPVLQSDAYIALKSGQALDSATSETSAADRKLQQLKQHPSRR